MQDTINDLASYDESLRNHCLARINPMKDKLLQWINLALMIDLFLVLISFFWFVIALIGHTAGIPLGWDLWYKLWEPVFTPAIGILMAGALLSGAISWLNKRWQSRSTNS